MQPSPIEDLQDFLHVAWDPRAADRRVGLARRRFVGAVGGLVVTVLVWGGYYLWSRTSGQQWGGTGQWTITGAVLGFSVAVLLGRLVAWRTAVRHRRRLGEGEVITASWPGLQIAGYYWDWDRVAGRVESAPARWGGEDRYVFRTPNGPWECEVEDLDTTPAALDAALRLYSRGRCALTFDHIAH